MMTHDVIEFIEQHSELATTYASMLQLIREAKPAIDLAITQHGKAHSEFQYRTVDCSGPVAGPTKLRNWRHALAVIQQTHDALSEAVYRVRKKRAVATMLRRKAEANGERDEILLLDADFAEQMANRIVREMTGAVRKLASYVIQWRELEKQIRQELGRSETEPITEADFEADEERFHVMKAFEQALLAARANGRIDHGNMLYLSDIGICGALAQAEIGTFLSAEHKYIQAHPHETHAIYAKQMEWIRVMADKYAGCGEHLAMLRGHLPNQRLIEREAR